MKNKIILLSALLVMLLVLCFTACGNNEPPEPESYTIQYTDNTGNHAITVKTGEVYSLESIPQKTGYDFLGLFDMEEGGTQYVTATGNSLAAFNDNRNMTLFPQFKAKEYTVILNYGEAEATGSREIKVAYGSEIGALPTNLTVANKTFAGWYTAENKQGTQIGDKYGILPDKKLLTEKIYDLSNEDGYVYLFAGFKYQEYTLTLYIGENSVPEEILVEWGTHISSVQTETRVDGKAVLTWSKSKNDTTLANVFNGKVEGDMILYSAEYAPVIDFNTMGGNEVDSIVNRVGNTISLPTPKRENYTFMGWFDTTGTQFTSTAMPENSLTLNAKWQANIMLNENGGTDVQDVTAPAGTAIELPTPERAGYIFAGWYNGNEKYTSTAMPENSITLTAKWYKILTKKIELEDDVDYVEYDKEGRFYSINLKDLEGLSTNNQVEISLKYVLDIDQYTLQYGHYYKHDLKIGLYSNNKPSDAYLISGICTHSYEEYEENLTTEHWLTIELKHTVKLSTNQFYIGFSCYRNGCDSDVHMKSAYVEIQYPDMSVLY